MIEPSKFPGFLKFDRKRKLRRSRNGAAMIFIGTTVGIVIDSELFLYLTLGFHAFIWLYYTVVFTGDLRGLELDEEPLHKN